MNKVAIGRTRLERNQSVARRMWKYYQRNGGHWRFVWVGVVNWEAMDRATN